MTPPFVIMSQAHGAIGEVRDLIAADSRLACTAGAGLLPLCEQASAAWRLIERGGGPLSNLAAMNIRSVVSALRAVLLMQTGCQEWCEISIASGSAGEEFLSVYPDARVVCMYYDISPGSLLSIVSGESPSSSTRNQPDPLRWLPFDKAIRYRYWAESAQSLLALETKFPQNCQRILCEELLADPRAMLAKLYRFLEIPFDAPRVGPYTPIHAELQPRQCVTELADDCPSALWAEIHELLSNLGYAT